MPIPDEWRLNRPLTLPRTPMPTNPLQTLDITRLSLFNNILTSVRQGAAGTGVASIPFMQSGSVREFEPIRSVA
jgi:hypothetical protein